MEWKPTAKLTVLRKRAKIIQSIREFFRVRKVLEVETPVLSQATVTDPYIQGMSSIFKKMGAQQEQLLYLQTSPEYAMKRLLAAGSGPIYQICKAFRQGDLGRVHQPEFTMLEWYRPGFDHQALMDEVDSLLQLILETMPADRLSYANAFEKYVGINPHTATLAELTESLNYHRIQYSSTSEVTVNVLLDLLLTHCIEPHIGQACPVFLYDFPVSQAALAKIRQEQPPVASRFEVYFKRLELANGFHELQDFTEQATRFANDLSYRQEQGLPLVTIDELFLAGLKHGLPDCAGVALGVDRLIMLALGCQSLREVISFGLEI